MYLFLYEGISYQLFAIFQLGCDELIALVGEFVEEMHIEALFFGLFEHEFDLNEEAHTARCS